MAAGRATVPGTGLGYFWILVVGRSISAYGTFLDLVAVGLFAYAVTASAAQTGLVMAVRLGVGFVVSWPAGVLATRSDRRRIMVGADLVAAVALVGLVLAPDTAQPAALYAAAGLLGCCQTLSLVALRSAVPELVGQDQRVRANGLLVTGRSFAMMLGFASAGVVVSWLGYDAAFLVDAATFCVSAACVVLLPAATRSRADAVPPAERTTPAVPTHRIALGLLASVPVIAVMIGIRAVDAFGSASHNVALPIYSSDADTQHPARFMSTFWTAWAVGSVLAHQVLRRVPRWRDGPGSEYAFAAGTAVMSASFILAFTGPSWPLLIGIAVCAGLADGFTEITYVSRLQTTPDEQRGALFGFSSMAENCGFMTGMVLSSGLLERFTPLAVVGFSHGVAIALALLFLLYLVRHASRGAATWVGGTTTTGA